MSFPDSFTNKVSDFFNDFGKSVNDTIKINDRTNIVNTWKIIAIATLIIGLALTFFSGTLFLIIPSVVLSTLSVIVIVDTVKVSNRLNDLGFFKGLVENSFFLNILADDTILLRHLIS